MSARPICPRLVELELRSDLDTFHRAALTYSEVLGTVGIDEYRRLIEPRFDEAVRWCERGLTDHADRPRQLVPLRECLARLHRDRGEADAAVDVFWAGFDDPSHPFGGGGSELPLACRSEA